MEKDIINIPAILTDKGYLSDGGRKLVLITNEITDEQAYIIAKLGKGTFGFFVFSPHEITSDELSIPEFEPEFKTDKTPSQRLRDCMYRYYEAKNKGDTSDFEVWYKTSMSKLADSYLEKLTDLQV